MVARTNVLQLCMAALGDVQNRLGDETEQRVLLILKTQSLSESWVGGFWGGSIYILLLYVHTYIFIYRHIHAHVQRSQVHKQRYKGNSTHHT